MKPGETVLVTGMSLTRQFSIATGTYMYIEVPVLVHIYRNTCTLLFQLQLEARVSLQ